MQEFPAWHHELKDSNEDLIEEYVAIWWVQKGMNVALGLGTVSLSPDKIAGDARKAVFAMPNVGESATVTGRLGRGMAAAGSSFGKVFTGGYQERQLSVDLYQRAFGAGTPLPTRYVFKAP